MTKSKSISQDIESPLCELRAEYPLHKKFKITDYNVYVPNLKPHHFSSDIGESKLYQMLELHSELCIRFENINNTYLVLFSGELMEYFVNQHDCKEIDDIINLDIEGEFIAENELKIDDEISVYIYSYSKCDKLLYTDIQNKYPEKSVPAKRDIHIQPINKNMNKKYIKNKLTGEGKIIEHYNKKEDNTIYTIVNVKINDDIIEFELEYPDVYDEDNTVVKFINDVGKGSVHGLDGSKVKIESEEEIDNPPSIKNGLALTSIPTNEINKSNNKNYTLMFFVKAGYWGSSFLAVFAFIHQYTAMFATFVTLLILFLFVNTKIDD